MTKQTTISSGLLLFRRSTRGIEVLLAHPGGPFWAKRDAGVWSIPKGLVEHGEDLLDAAKREFREETGIVVSGPFIPLGAITQKAGKTVHAWACEGDADARSVTSNTVRMEWPRGSGKWLTFPEIDRCEWCDPATARRRLNPAQAEFIDRLRKDLA